MAGQLDVRSAVWWAVLSAAKWADALADLKDLLDYLSVDLMAAQMAV